MTYYYIFVLLLSTIFSLISYIVVTTIVDRKSKKMLDEMYSSIFDDYKKRSSK
ncbi:hypothetical protein AF69_06065 [Streptococcus uberis 6736]|nr:hypothetical protein AF69_06065 [Streptococcus uberis 6736]